MTKDRVRRIIGLIGKKADVEDQVEDARTQHRVKYASAHDIRRGLAQRLINAGVSAETLKVVMRHKDFATTESTTVQCVWPKVQELKSSPDYVPLQIAAHLWGD